MPACSGCSGAVVMPKTEKKEEKKEEKKSDKKTTTSNEVVRSEAPARILVTVPTGATLRVDGQVVNGTSSSRLLVSPALPVSQTYHYTLQAEITRDGQNMVQTREITVRGGEQTTTTFDFNTTQGVVSSR